MIDATAGTLNDIFTRFVDVPPGRHRCVESFPVLVSEGNAVLKRADWERVEAVFHELADLPDGEERLRQVREACGDDPALIAEVCALLEGDRLVRESTPGGEPHTGHKLGPFTVTRLIARGGMASVHEGRRDDGAFTQRVAVKIMDLRLSAPGLVAQFKAEREILAALEHPSVTRLVDGGVTDRGEPYLVMEFVDGQPIDGTATNSG